MIRPRIIPVLLIRNKRLVKTKYFDKKHDRYIGCPINAARIYSEKGADELVVFDIEASLRGKLPDFKLIESISKQCSMPFCYGGGITSIEQARRLIRSGAEKVSLNTAAAKTPHLIESMANEFGSQSVVVTLDIKTIEGKYSSTYFNGTKTFSKETSDLVQELKDRGTGEFIFNFIDRDGSRTGYDIQYLKKLTFNLDVPFTVVGGANDHTDIQTLFREVPGAAAGLGSSFVFTGPLEAVLINYPSFEDRSKLTNPSLGRPNAN